MFSVSLAAPPSHERDISGMFSLLLHFVDELIPFWLKVTETSQKQPELKNSSSNCTDFPQMSNRSKVILTVTSWHLLAIIHYSAP